MEVPLLDFSSFTNGSSNQQKRFCRDLADSFQKYGFVKLANHGISEAVMKEVFDHSYRFFCLSMHEKMKAAHPPAANPHRGYSMMGLEKISGITGFEKGKTESVEMVDIKETFDQGPNDDRQFPNIWPDECDIPSFREQMERYFDLCHNALLRILQALAIGLNLPPGYFDMLHSRREHELRLLHYPETPVAELQREDKTRIAEHSDFGSITLLLQDGTGGLEVEDQAREGLFEPVECPYPIMLVNIGDCMQRWTNDRLHSACHRVTIPAPLKHERQRTVPERFSVAFFGKPNRDASISPLAPFVSLDRPSRYGDLSAGEYNQAKLTRTY
ncbi:MAG: hypothetical protein Q9202_006452 [Teloschistes flavicans]